MIKTYSLTLFLLGSVYLACWGSANHITPTEHVYLDMLKGNIDNEHVFEDSLSYIGDPFYVNEYNMLQIDGVKRNLCKNLSSDGYNCSNGTLITKLSPDPSIRAAELIERANALMSEIDALTP